MFHPLPAQTVFEARQRAKRDTALLFTVLVFLYILFADLMALAVFLFVRLQSRHPNFDGLGPVLFWTTGLAALVAITHFFIARSRPLDSILDQIGALSPDPQDEVHARFLNLVGEAEAATGIQGIRPVLLSTPGCNAFSLQDGNGNCAIGVTEGILTRLSRNELSAVVAHEAAHLVHEDSRLVTTACFLFGVFGGINQVIGQVLRGGTSRKGFPPLVIVLWVISGVGYFITRWISMSLSREREYFADSDGVQMCKDPLAMAEGLYKISGRYKGNFSDNFAAMFILNPAQSGLHEDEGFFPNLFSTHPPVFRRIDKLLDWAKSDLKTLEEAADKEKPEGASSGVGGITPHGEKASFMLSQDGNWAGPYTPLQMLSLGNLTPGSWVCPTGSQDVTQASQVAELLPLFEDKVKGSRSKSSCPRCKTPLLVARYEGAEVEHCGFCEGHLLPLGVLERIVIREEETFTGDQVRKAKAWRDSSKASFGSRDPFPAILCPHCGGRMAKAIHSAISQVMIDRCVDFSCGAVWCDGGELETIQILMEDARKMTRG